MGARRGNADARRGPRRGTRLRACADHHVALRVSDIERAARFYAEALGGRLLTRPSVREGRYIEEVFGGPPGLEVKACLIAFDAGAVELWEFLRPVRPLPDEDQTGAGIMHFAVRVDDVSEALRRVEAAGGRARFPVKRIGAGGGRFVYCEDPDGHVFELLDTAVEETARMIVEAVPEAAPAVSAGADPGNS